ncbi:MAG: methionine adenosyltransferase [Candidatus Micrarchaeaceae archaeon]
MRNIRVAKLGYGPLKEQGVEYVERKGKGHPDTLIDGIAERFSVELSKRYIDEFGGVLHHNVDKALIVGGESDVHFGNCRITKPIEIILSGRASRGSNANSIPVEDIAIEAAKSYLRENTRFLDIENEVIYTPKVLQGSKDLSALYERSADIPLANDTSFGVGFAPLSDTEKVVLEIEKNLNSPEFKRSYPAVGEDIKVMGVRDGNKISVTIAAAMVGNLLSSKEDYAAAKDKVSEAAMSVARRITKMDTEIFVNTGDGDQNSGFYITKSGLSCENGDDGEVGRGNRVNGLITPFRHMTLEAAAGKNPVNHVGKIYSIAANEIANDIVSIYPQVIECNVYILSQIGTKISEPKHLNIEVALDTGVSLDTLRNKIYDIADSSMENLGYLTREILDGKYNLGY